jgi:hypothetical protein
LKDLLPEEVYRRADFIKGENNAVVDKLNFEAVYHSGDYGRFRYTVRLVRQCPGCHFLESRSGDILTLSDIAREMANAPRLCASCQEKEAKEKEDKSIEDLPGGFKLIYPTVAERLEQLIRQIVREVVNGDLN